MDDVIIRDYISRELVKDATLLPLQNSTPLLDSGILDSLSLLTLVVFIQDQFGIAVDYADVVPEHFADVNAICAYVRSQTAAKAAGGHA